MERTPMRKKPGAGIVIIWMFLLTACGAAAENGGDAFVAVLHKQYPDLKNHQSEKAAVERVVDGDTFVIKGEAKVRLIGVNTPEISGGGEAYGQEAKEFTNRNLTGKTVYLFRDAGDTDRYGRLLRYVFVDGEVEMFNDQLVREGYAMTMTIPPNVLYADRFVELERQAREGNKGLWGISDADAKVPSSCKEPQIKGNINSRGEKIYHLPGSRYYEQTKAEFMFCTEDEAEEAGYREPKK
ncbi:thermonuclease family protein [Paenibacillus tarimensis]